MRSLLHLVRLHEGALEADLARAGVDLRDRWRRDELGVRRLTLRRLGNLVRHLPPDSAVAVALGGDGFTKTHLLLMDVVQAMSGQPHPARPKVSAQRASNPERDEMRRAAKRRARERQQQIEAGAIT